MAQRAGRGFSGTGVQRRGRAGVAGTPLSVRFPPVRRPRGRGRALASRDACGTARRALPRRKGSAALMPGGVCETSSAGCPQCEECPVDGPVFVKIFFIAKISCTYAMNYLHGEKCLRDHEAYCEPVFPFNPLLGHIAAQAAAIRLPGLSLVSRNSCAALFSYSGGLIKATRRGFAADCGLARRAGQPGTGHPAGARGRLAPSRRHPA
jgi:hypothetical protein